MNFHVGDIVRVLEDSEDGKHSFSYKRGELYTVYKIDNPQNIKTISLKDGVKNGWFSSYFELVERPLKTPTNDLVDHPDHYKSSKLEVIDIIEEFNLSFSLGNTIKYILRAGKKDPTKILEDYKKARWHLDREIQKLEES